MPRPWLRAPPQVMPTNRAVLSLLAYCHYQQEEFEAAAQA